MIEFVSSKVVGAVVAVVLLASILGFFSIQRSAAEERQFREMCETLSRAIDGVSSAGAETVLKVSFGAGGPGLHLDFSFRNKGYDVEVRAGQVILRQGALTAVSPLTRAVHPWNPKMLGNGTELHVSEEELERHDSNNTALKVPSGRDFVVESRLLHVLGVPMFETFVRV